jgi:hypothetical protein
MPLICYQKHNFDPGSLEIIHTATNILEDYAAQGYDLTLRQLYYQFVARGIIPNKDTEYKRLGSIINDARLAGLVDWSHITDRTRNMQQNSHWSSPREIIEACQEQYQIDKWKRQTNYLEVWVEKDALIGVLEVACRPLDVPFFSCRGYTSQSEMWAASQRLLAKLREGKTVHIIHLGDHDPSGIDMSRDIEDRLTLFLRHHRIRDYCQAHLKASPSRSSSTALWISPVMKIADTDAVEPVTVHRIALNMDQVRQYNPPPNPAKLSDARAKGYIEQYGEESWELDALEPAVITGLIQSAVDELRDGEAFKAALEEERQHREKLLTVARSL